MRITKLIKTVITASVFSALALAATVSAQTFKTPKDWKRINKCNTAFYVPATLKDIPVQGIDSCTAKLIGTGIRLNLDAGMYSGKPERDAATMLGYQTRKFVAGGQPAEVITYSLKKGAAKTNGERYFATLHIPLVGANSAINITVSAHNKKDIRNAQRIFETVRFDGTM